MPQPRGKFCFEAKLADGFCGALSTVDHHFQGDKLVQAKLPGLVNHPHASASDEFDQLEVTEVPGALRFFRIPSLPTITRSAQD